ncbi:unnamed protein product [Haemonchus placei]|uniref:Cytochrome c oxidase subunit II n=1 Tax=Haemonchus placei TaxID=6290 RepID=A0A0N4WAY0_HAEPC|nr:unnamed protein product [Haemonchus placei]
MLEVKDFFVPVLDIVNCTLSFRINVPGVFTVSWYYCVGHPFPVLLQVRESAFGNYWVTKVEQDEVVSALSMPNVSSSSELSKPLLASSYFI